ncbi:MAG: dTDP-4-dehydrorhamnose reductase [Bacilli bacterium]|nr:dTDP-4-dehydrorhamnose reductase [Bacilli bacterium]
MQNITIKDTNLRDCKEVVFKKFSDIRGYFASVTENHLFGLGMNGFQQVSESLSSKGTLRGMHFQRDPYCQAKLVGCVQGKVLDVVVDCRHDSETYGKYTMVELSPETRNMLYVPRGFAHGFLALEEDTIFQYIVDNQYNYLAEDGIAYDDSYVNIPWDEIKEKYGIKELILSNKDSNRHGLIGMQNEFSIRPKKFLVTGYNGQLGFDIVNELHARGEYDIVATTRQDLDITNREAVFNLVKEYKPDVIIHCAAWTQVDQAEEECEKAIQTNVIGTQNLTDAASAVGAKIVYPSTDYVFDGTKNGIYTEEDTPNPMSVYGETKYQGEEIVSEYPKHYIARISWVFGINGKNFIKTMLRLSKTKKELTVVDDQVGSPSYTIDLAKTLVDMAYSDKYGTYNVTNEGYCSWADLADYVMKSNNIDTKIIPISTGEYIKAVGKRQAFRPANSRLDKSKLVASGFNQLPGWQDATDRYVRQLKKSTRIEDKRLFM